VGVPLREPSPALPDGVGSAAVGGIGRWAGFRDETSAHMLRYVIDAKERGRDIAEALTNELRSTCTTIEIPVGLSVEDLMTTTPRHRNVPDLRNVKAAPGSMHHRPARRFKRRSSGTIRTKGLGS
jgi:hypothetical protein